MADKRSASEESWHFPDLLRSVRGETSQDADYIERVRASGMTRERWRRLRELARIREAEGLSSQQAHREEAP